MISNLHNICWEKVYVYDDSLGTNWPIFKTIVYTTNVFLDHDANMKNRISPRLCEYIYIVELRNWHKYFEMNTA